MPKKPLAKKTTPKRKPLKPSTGRKTKSQAKPNHSEEYAEYLERHELLGRSRPLLTSAQYDQYDDELLDLLALEMERGLDDDQTIRVKELEYLLIDSDQ